jgi:hypothetical protein
MATADEYAQWIVNNQDKKGSTEFDIVAQAYEVAKQEEATAAAPNESAAETQRLASKPKPKARLPFSMDVSVDPESKFGQFLSTMQEKTMTPREDGSAQSRFVEGMMNPAYGVGQLAMNIAGQGDEINSQMADRQRRLEAAKKQAGVEGIDVAGITGEILSPVNLAGGKYIDELGNLLKPGVTQTAAKGAAFAALQPVTTEGTTNYWAEKATQAGVGAVGGVVVDKTIGGLSVLSNILRTHFTDAGRQTALRKHIDSLAGPEREQVIKRLQDAQELVTGSKPTVAELLSDLPSAVNLISKQGKLANEEGILQSLFAQRTAEQQAARVRALQGISGTEASRTGVAATRDRVTGAARETALSQADEARLALGQLDKQGNARAAALIQQNRSLFPADIGPTVRFSGVGKDLGAGELKNQVARRTAALKQTQLTSLEQNGTFPIYAKDLLSVLDDRIKAENTDIGKAALQGIRDKIASKADDNGILSSRDLYDNVRKTMNQDIAKLLGQGEQFAAAGLPQQAAKAAGDIKKAIDASLDRTSSGLWSKYLADYQKYSQKLNQMEVGQYLVDKLSAPGLDKERVGVFANAVADAAGTIKRSTGIPRYDKLTDVLEPKQMAVVTNVLEDLKRGDLARRMQKNASDGGLPEAQKIVPPTLTTSGSILRNVLSFIQQGNQKKFNEELGKLLLNPKDMATLMTNVPKSRVEPLTQALMKAATPENRQRMVLMFTVPPLATESGEGFNTLIDRGE